MSFFDRYKKKKEETPKKTEEKKNDYLTKTEERDAAWAATVEKPKTVEEKPEVKKETTKEVKKEVTKEPKPKKEVTKATKKEEPKMAEKKPAAKKQEVKVWHISKREEDGQWQVKAQGAQKATKLFRTKAEAEEYVKTLKANNEGSRVIKHKKTGEFQKK
jgi:hypothetical protein